MIIGVLVSTIVQFSCIHAWSMLNRLGSLFVMYIVGFPHVNFLFFLYLSVTVNSSCAPSQALYVLKLSKSPIRSSMIAYSASVLSSSMLKNWFQYMCLPIDVSGAESRGGAPL